jgi:large subunit ribosomal protein L19
MSKIIEAIDLETRKGNPQARYRAGDTVRVHVRITEGAKERIQVFEGLIIARRDRGVRSSITVRKVSHGIGVERIFPIYSPVIARIEWKRRNKIRRAKLYYIRSLRGKKARLAEVRIETRPAVETFEA